MSTENTTAIENRVIPGITGRLLAVIVGTSVGVVISVLSTYNGTMGRMEQNRNTIMSTMEKNRGEVLDLVKDVRNDQTTYIKITDLRLQTLEANIKILEQRISDIEKNKVKR